MSDQIRAWRKSSHSGANYTCVEVTALAARVGVRDSKQGDRAPVLRLSASAWRSLLEGIKAGRIP
ncbi:DUF397 domain-containing protein [Thermomonospora catenispora]|uniref:DUF397 domain-containing protein n=1 Tax=Thermomonospora catenispora TaxID=2493090 RepID=UPI00111E06DB|nr:DUF397 domain-containing protein [Thermomonospora catenispora]TNY38769.1 DUF397 domain-containing protein [Thermomonospora catenispora]